MGEGEECDEGAGVGCVVDAGPDSVENGGGEGGVDQDVVADRTVRRDTRLVTGLILTRSFLNLYRYSRSWKNKDK